jgi:hypothetical protein
MNQQIHPHPDLLPSREKELRFVIRIGAFRREDLTNQIRHCEDANRLLVRRRGNLIRFIFIIFFPRPLTPSRPLPLSI